MHLKNSPESFRSPWEFMPYKFENAERMCLCGTEKLHDLFLHSFSIGPCESVSAQRDQVCGSPRKTPSYPEKVCGAWGGHAHFYSPALFWTDICQHHRLVLWILNQWVNQIFHRNSIINQKNFTRCILGYFLNSIEGVNQYAGHVDQNVFRIMRNKFSCLVVYKSSACFMFDKNCVFVLTVVYRMFITTRHCKRSWEY